MMNRSKNGNMSHDSYQQMKANFEKYAPKLYKNHIFIQIQIMKIFGKSLENN